MTAIAKDTVVQFNYTLTNGEGETLDQSRGEPLAYLHGHHNIIPGLEAQMEGKKAGDKFKATVAPEDAYGEYIAEEVQEVPRQEQVIK